MEDVKVKTKTGAFCKCLATFHGVQEGCVLNVYVIPVTILSAAIILAFTTIEFLDYRRVNLDTSIVVDKSRGERLTMRMNVTFPRVPCYCTFPRHGPFGLLAVPQADYGMNAFLICIFLLITVLDI